MQALIEAKADPDFQDRWGGTALAEAVREGHTKVVEYLCGQGASLMWDEAKTSGELCEFARAGDVERVKMLLDCGCDANAADYDKRTCLHLACSVVNWRVVQQLIEHGVDVNFQDRWGGTGLSDASREGHREISEFLLQKGSHFGDLGPSRTTAHARITICAVPKAQARCTCN